MSFYTYIYVEAKMREAQYLIAVILTGNKVRQEDYCKFEASLERSRLDGVRV